MLSSPVVLEVEVNASSLVVADISISIIGSSAIAAGERYNTAASSTVDPPESLLRHMKVVISISYAKGGVYNSEVMYNCCTVFGF